MTNIEKLMEYLPEEYEASCKETKVIQMYIASKKYTRMQ